MRLSELTPMRASRRWLADHRVLWQQLLVIAGLLLFSLLVAARVPFNLALVLIALPGLLVGGYVLVRWPAAGLLGLVAGSLLFPSEIVYVIGVTALVTLGLTAVWLFDMLVIKRQLVFVQSRTFPPLLLYLAVTVIAFLNGQLPWFPIQPAPLDGQVGGILILIVVICAYLLVANRVRDERWLKALVFLFIGIGALFMFLRVMPGMTPLLRRIFAPQIPSGSMFWTWLAVMAFSQAVFNRGLARHWRWLCGGVLLATLYIAFGEARAWVSGWFPMIVALGVTIWLGAPRQAFWVTMVSTAVLLTQLQSFISGFLYVGDNEYSQMTRLEAWRIIGEIIKVSPVLGLGPANYSYYTPLYPILGYYIQFNSHNNYVDIVAQTGILGLIFIIWFIVEIVRLAWRLYQIVPRGGFLYAFVIGAFGGLVATFVSGMLGDWFLPYVYNATIRSLRTSILPWLFMGGLVAVEQILRARNNGQLPMVNGQSSTDDKSLTIDY
jgi:hypothetical protein